MSSMQHKLDRVRRPRVQITYDVETNGAMQKVELPFVVGVLADLSGQPNDAAAAAQGTEGRQHRPRQLQRRAGQGDAAGGHEGENKLTDEDTKLAVELNFKNIDDFEPARVAEQVGPLKELLDMRLRADAAAEQDGRQRQARAAAGRRAEQHRQGQGAGEADGHRAGGRLGDGQPEAEKTP